MRRITTMLATVTLLVALCAGAALAATLVGTNDPDRIVGTPNNDRIEGQGGADFVEGGGGSDLLLGGSGDDHLNGISGERSATTDEIRCGSGNDYVVATRTDVVASDCETVTRQNP